MAAIGPIAKPMKPLSYAFDCKVAYQLPVHLYGDVADMPLVVPAVDVAHVKEVKYD